MRRRTFEREVRAECAFSVIGSIKLFGEVISLSFHGSPSFFAFCSDLTRSVGGKVHLKWFLSSAQFALWRTRLKLIGICPI